MNRKFSCVLAFVFSVLGANVLAASLDRATLDQAMTRAQTENKSVILEVSAAWCGPCNEFAYDMDHHPQNLKSLSDSGYIMVKMESEKVAEGDALWTTDFMPMLIKFFPSFYLYTPGHGWKFLGTVTSYADLTSMLHAVATAQPMTVAEFKTYIESIGPVTGSDLYAGDTGFRVGASLYNLADNYDYTQAKAVLGLLSTENTKFPALQIGDTVTDVESLFMMNYVGNGQVTIDVLAQEFPTAFASLTDVSRDDFSTQLFGLKVAYTLKKSGLAAAVAQCNSLWQGVRSAYVKGTLSDTDFQANLASFDLNAAVECADLELTMNGATPALKQKVAALDATKITNWHLLAGLGNIPAAVAVYHKQFTRFSDGYNKQLQSLNASLATTTDPNTLKQIHTNIDLLTFKLQNHTNVDNDVETALTAGVPVAALKVLN